MALFLPTAMFHRIYSITPEWLRQNGIRALILDVDNTLTGHGSQELTEPVRAWLEQMRAEGFAMMIASNNIKRRIMPFAEKIGLPFRTFCCKPSPFGLWAAQKQLNCKKSEIALVGDQIFTDVLGANLAGIPMLLVQPMHNDTKITIRLKRAMERPFLARYAKRGGKIIKKED